MTSPVAPISNQLRQTLLRLAQQETLGLAETRAAFAEVMQGEVPAAVIGGMLLAMRARGETSDELAGAVAALRDVMQTVAHPAPDTLVDTCGTGGGGVSTLNISTAAAFVAAGAGVPVAKHGNRSFTSRSGSADVLEALGIGIEGTAEHAARVLQEVGLVFLFAPTYHPAMRHVGPIRRALGVPTLMNLVGPLANPASVRRQVIGVADAERAPLVAQALLRLGTIHSWVVRAEIGMDELSPVGRTTVWEVRDGRVQQWLLDPADVGLATTTLEGLAGGEPRENAARIEALFDAPDDTPAALRSAVLLNAAAAILVSGMADTLADAVAAASAALRDGRASERLKALRRASPGSSVSTSG